MIDAADNVQAHVNDALWSRTNLVKTYARRDLRPVEVILLARYGEALGGRVLELGCGGGRVTGYLAALGGAVLGIDISAAMVGYCRRTYPEATFEEQDLRDLSDHATGGYGTVVASYNVLDVLDDAERRHVLEEVRRVLAPGGLLVFSSHNRAYAPLIAEPTQVLSRKPLRLAANIVRLPRRLRNRRRLVPFEREEPGYAILNDSAHEYAVLHYYVSRDDQQRQLAEQGLELLECLDLEGGSVPAGEQAPACPELHYVARSRSPV